MQTFEHMQFKGISFDSDIDTFAVSMEKIGYTQTYISENHDYSTFIGSFAEESYCEISVFGTKTNKLVSFVIVHFPKQDSWNSLKFMYEKFKRLYTKKYGDPDYVDEHFDHPYDDGDGRELKALELEKCEYRSSFVTHTGDIQLFITSEQNVDVWYCDTINSNILKAESEQAILNEI